MAEPKNTLVHVTSAGHAGEAEDGVETVGPGRGPLQLLATEVHYCHRGRGLCKISAEITNIIVLQR